ncbi:MAG: hypothetical protein ACK461_09490, partial [Bacteroidota bacterium]
TGFEDRAIHFRSMNLGSGSAMAMPIYGYYMQNTTKDSSVCVLVIEFEAPKQPLSVEINCNEYDQQPDQKKLELIEE